MCIAPLNNNTGDKQYDALAEGFADMLVAALAGQENITVVERQRLREVLKEQKLTLLGLTAPATAVRVGRILKADRMLVGGITRPKEELVINVHAYQIQTARLITSVQAQGKTGDIFQLANNLVGRLCKGLNVQLKPVDPNDVDKNPNASLHFIRGLGFYYVGHLDHAIVEFMKTVHYESTHTKARLWTAKVYIQTKEYTHARIELNEIIKDFPKSEQAAPARKLLQECEEHLKTAEAQENKQER
jgi:TolB-like protein